MAPLRNLPVIRDLVVDMREFFDKWARAKGEFRGRQTRRTISRRAARSAAEARRRRHRMHRLRRVLRRVRRGEVEPGLPRPAALNRAWTLNDVRDAGP